MSICTALQLLQCVWWRHCMPMEESSLVGIKNPDLCDWQNLCRQESSAVHTSAYVCVTYVTRSAIFTLLNDTNFADIGCSVAIAWVFTSSLSGVLGVYWTWCLLSLILKHYLKGTYNNVSLLSCEFGKLQHFWIYIKFHSMHLYIQSSQILYKHLAKGDGIIL